MVFDVYDENHKKVVGWAAVFPDGIVALHGKDTGSTFYSNLKQMKEIHPYWTTRERVG